MEKRNIPDTRLPIAMFCNNCGGKGHLFRMCTDPVLSCGIILIDAPTLPAPKANLVMIRRKDSMSFAEFLRGKYDPTNIEYVSKLVSNMTMGEQESILNHTWRDEQLPDFGGQGEKFAQMDLETIIKNNPSPYPEPEWGFPKGRRVRGESDIDCALREFGEETNIPRDCFTVLKNIRLEETFEGLNGVQYKHIYFVCLLQQPDMVHIDQRFTPMQRREISAIGWKTMAECEKYIRPHHIQRKVMLDQLKLILDSYETV